jgi:hypothetical protein
MCTKEEKYRRLLKKSQTDEVFREKLMSSPIETLLAEGIAVPKGFEVNVVKNSPTHMTLVIPGPGDIY